MKIISKFKDFYDYKVAKYGIDEKLVYIRKTYCEYFQVLIGNIKNPKDIGGEKIYRYWAYYTDTKEII